MERLAKKIEAIAVKKQDEEEEKYFQKYYSIFETAYQYLVSKDILLYGGTALNELLPDKMKIYKVNSLPDIDIFSKNAHELAKRLVKHFISKGFSSKTTSLTEALHEGTYKVFVDGVPVVDISNITHAEYKVLYMNSTISKTYSVRVVNPQFIRMSLHLIMSKAESDSLRRWEKVLNRMNLFYKQFPPKRVCTNKLVQPVEIPDLLTESLRKILTSTECILFGMDELKELLGETATKYTLPAYFQAFTREQDLYLVATRIIEQLYRRSEELQHMADDKEDSDLKNIREITKNIKISKVFTNDKFLPPYIHLLWHNKPCLTIFSTENCMTYNMVNGDKIGSIHGILYMYLSMTLSTSPLFVKHRDTLECLANALTVVYQKKHMTSKLFQDVIQDCYGNYDGLITMRKARLLRVNKKNPVK